MNTLKDFFRQDYLHTTKNISQTTGRKPWRKGASWGTRRIWDINIKMFCKEL